MNECIFGDGILKTYIQSQLNDPWSGTDFEGYVCMGAKQKGVFGELYIKKYLTQLGFNISSRTSSEHDLMVDGIKTEVKFSIAQKDTRKDHPNTPRADTFMINHVGDTKDWERLVFIGINPGTYPNRVMWFDKDFFSNHKNKLFKHQQGGKKTNNDDYIANSTKILQIYNHPAVHRDFSHW